MYIFFLKAEIVNQVEPERRQIVTTATIIPTKPPEEKTKLLLTVISYYDKFLFFRK